MIGILREKSQQEQKPGRRGDVQRHRARLGWQRHPSGDVLGACPRLRVVSDPRKPPAQLDGSRPLSLLIKGGADRGGIVTGGLLQREPDLQSDLIALNLSVLDRTPHLLNFEPARFRNVPEALLIALSIALEMLCSDVPTTSTTL